jgi:RNA recognition motif-containing protein
MRDQRGGGGCAGQPRSDPPVNADERCIFITNIDIQVPKSQLHQHFERWGAVELVKIRENQRRNATTKFAFITFFSAGAARASITREAQSAHKSALGGNNVFAKHYERRGAHVNTHDMDSRAGTRFARNDNR